MKERNRDVAAEEIKTHLYGLLKDILSEKVAIFALEAYGSEDEKKLLENAKMMAMILGGAVSPEAGGFSKDEAEYITFIQVVAQFVHDSVVGQFVHDSIVNNDPSSNPT